MIVYALIISMVYTLQTFSSVLHIGKRQLHSKSRSLANSLPICLVKPNLLIRFHSLQTSDNSLSIQPTKTTLSRSTADGQCHKHFVETILWKYNMLVISNEEGRISQASNRRPGAADLRISSSLRFRFAAPLSLSRFDEFDEACRIIAYTSSPSPSIAAIHRS